MSDLQEVTERLAQRLSRSVAIDNPRMELQSYSPHYGAVDEQRLASILQRRATEEAVRWAHRYGIAKAHGWTRLPSDPHVDMLGRVCVTLRYRDTLIGYLWLIDADGSLTDADLELAVEAGDEAAAIMYRDSLFVDLERARERELLRDLLNTDTAVRQQAVSALAEELRVDVDVPVVAIVLDTARERALGDSGTVADIALTHGRQLLPTRHALHIVRPDHGLLLIAPGREIGAVEIANRVQAEYQRGLPSAHAARVGIGDTVATLAEAATSYRQALNAISVGRVLNLDAVVRWADLGIYRLLAQLPLAEIGEELLHPALGKLAAYGDDGQLLRTLEVFLDAAGDVKSAADELFLHRTSLYNRLARIEEIGQVDLRNGTDRLALHLGIKIGHLSGRISDGREQRH